MVSKKWSLDYVERLECFNVEKLIRPAEASPIQQAAKDGAESWSGGIPVSRRTLNTVQPWQRKYVAVSYKWPPPGKAVAVGKYHTGMRPNKVQNVVLDRAINYAAYRKCPLLWIDQECVPENDPEKKSAQYILWTWYTN